jgi:hypothetical protein
MRFPKWRTIRLVAAFGALLAWGLAGWVATARGHQDVTRVLTSEHGANSAVQQKKHYVILVSLDGFRYDYAEKYHAKHLQALAAVGATAPEVRDDSCVPFVDFR